MTEYYNRLTHIKKFMFDKLSPRFGKIYFCLTQKKRSEKMILDFNNIFFYQIAY